MENQYQPTMILVLAYTR